MDLSCGDESFALPKDLLKGIHWLTRRARHFRAFFLQSNSRFEVQWPRILSYAVEEGES
jgi:hypothetical protein